MDSRRSSEERLISLLGRLMLEPEKRQGERAAKKVPSSLRILLRTQYISVVENATPETKGKGELSANPDNRFLRIPPAHTSTTEITKY